MIKFLKGLRETINLKLYSSKSIVLAILRILRLSTGVFMVGYLIYYYGYPQDDQSTHTMLMIVRGSYAFFMFSYLTRIIYDYEPRKFIKSNAVEGVLVSILFFDLLSSLFVGESVFKLVFDQLASERAVQLFGMLSQLFLLTIVMIEFGRASQRLTLLKLSPSFLFISSFLLLIFGGTFLLMLPEMTSGADAMPFLDALFTSTSASCVTGLIVVDTATYFTFKGQFLIMVLIQLGGLNMISFASFFAAFAQKGVGLRQHLMIKDFMSYDSLSSTNQLLKKVVMLTLVAEVTGAILIYMSWDPAVYFESIEHKIFFSVFHSISAFNNAGFSTFTNGLYEPLVRSSYFLHIIIAMLVIIGGLGAPILFDVFSLSKMKERLKYPWKRLQITSRLGIYASVGLVIGGMLIFMLGEWNNPAQYNEGGLYEKSYFGYGVTAFFQSVITRTAGFNTVDIGTLATPTLLAFILLMFIGASPGGTGGGIKTTTFAVAFLSAIATIRGKKVIEIYRHTISSELMYKAFSIFLFSLSVVFLGTFILTITDPDTSFIKLAFEEVSAFATVGLSTGITAGLSTGGKIVIILTMFVGRLGVLTLAFALSKKVISTNYKYPDAFVMIG